MGIIIGGYELYSLYFADDQVVIAEDKDNLGYMIRKLKMYCEQMGLKVNIDELEY
jgi:hypothetical protein